jgi:hypothetical protein
VGSEGDGGRGVSVEAISGHRRHHQRCYDVVGENVGMGWRAKFYSVEAVAKYIH